MLAHRTFADGGFSLNDQAVLRSQERVRREAEAFVFEEVPDGDLITISECAQGQMGPWLFAVTVWYRREKRAD